MELRYSTLKRSTLKDLLEARGQTASNKSKATLIAELMEGDGTSDRVREPATEGSEMSAVQREIQWLLALYDSPPPQEVITQIIADTTRLKMLEVQKSLGGAVPVTTTPTTTPAWKKLPHAAFRAFKDGEEEIDRFLQAFETQCELHGIEEADWVTVLVGKLSGRALDAMEAIPADERRDYERVKEKILARYAITPEAHRLKFRSRRRDEGQSYTEWAHQLSRSVDYWFTGCQATTLADAAQLVLLEQFFAQSPSDVREWVKDRNPLTVSHAAELADQFVDSRRTLPPEPRPPARALETSPRQPPVTRYPSAPVPARLAYNPPPRKTGIRCYGCHQVGHVKSNCPRNHHNTTWAQASSSAPRAAAHCLQVDGVMPASTWNEEDCGILHEVDPVQAAAGDNRLHHRQRVWVNGKPAQGLRDTGATLTLVQPSLLSKADQTGRSVAVRVAGGKVLKIPTARVHLNWGAGARDVEVGVMTNLPAEVLLGNDLGHLSSTYLVDLSPDLCP